MTSRTVKTVAFLSTLLVCASALAMHLMPAGGGAASPQFVQQLAQPVPQSHVVVVTGQRMSEAEKAAFDALQGS